VAGGRVKSGPGRWAFVGGVLVILFVGFMSYRLQTLTETVGRLEGENAALRVGYDAVVEAGDVDAPPSEDVADENIDTPVVIQRGADGASGERGSRGLPGQDGRDGDDGAPGPPGEPGPPGPAGSNGGPGSNGDPGAEGAQGPVGPIGATGPQGEPGPAGAQGPAGPIGATGPAPTGIVVPDGEGGWCTATDPDGDGVYACPGVLVPA
jgi:hypothetical protein